MGLCLIQSMLTVLLRVVVTRVNSGPGLRGVISIRVVFGASDVMVLRMVVRWIVRGTVCVLSLGRVLLRRL